MDLQKIIHCAMDLRRHPEVKETDPDGSPSSSLDIAQCSAGDVNHRVKLIETERGQRTIANSKENLETQPAHGLWSVVVLAQMHNVHLETSFREAMDRLENHLLETQA